MNSEREVQAVKRKLIKKAIRRGGIYENFGHSELLDLQSKYGYRDPNIDKFFLWSLHIDDRKLREEKSKLKTDKVMKDLGITPENLTKFFKSGKKKR